MTTWGFHSSLRNSYIKDRQREVSCSYSAGETNTTWISVYSSSMKHKFMRSALNGERRRQRSCAYKVTTGVGGRGAICCRALAPPGSSLHGTWCPGCPHAGVAKGVLRGPRSWTAWWRGLWEGRLALHDERGLETRAWHARGRTWCPPVLWSGSGSGMRGKETWGSAEETKCEPMKIQPTFFAWQYSLSNISANTHDFLGSPGPEMMITIPSKIPAAKRGILCYQEASSRENHGGSHPSDAATILHMSETTLLIHLQKAWGSSSEGRQKKSSTNQILFN